MSIALVKKKEKLVIYKQFSFAEVVLDATGVLLCLLGAGKF